MYFEPCRTTRRPAGSRAACSGPARPCRGSSRAAASPRGTGPPASGAAAGGRGPRAGRRASPTCGPCHYIRLYYVMIE